MKFGLKIVVAWYLYLASTAISSFLEDKKRSENLVRVREALERLGSISVMNFGVSILRPGRDDKVPLMVIRLFNRNQVLCRLERLVTRLALGKAGVENCTRGARTLAPRRSDATQPGQVHC